MLSGNSIIILNYILNNVCGINGTLKVLLIQDHMLVML